jgi:hypothetical protein
MLLRVLFGLLAGGGIVVACTSAPSAGVDRLCTPGAYVFCRCADRREGTKLCQPSGQNFAPCDCGEPGKLPELIPPDRDAGFVEIDSGPRPDGGLVLDGRCAGKLAVLSSSADDLFLYAAAYKGGGDWLLSEAKGPALRGVPRGAFVADSLVAVWYSRYQLIAWTKFVAGQTTLAPPVSVGYATTTKDPAFVGGRDQGLMFHLADGDSHQSGIYSPTAGWDDAITPVPNGANVTQKSAPLAAAPNGGLPVLAFTDGNGGVKMQTTDGGSWAAPVAIAGATVLDKPPEMVALEGTRDLLVVYEGKDLLFHSVARDAATGEWSAPVLVDTLASSDGTLSVTAIGDARAMMVWRSTNGSVQFSIWDSKTLAWSTPAAVAPATMKAIGIPQVTRGRCASDATVTWIDEEGAVYLALWEKGVWRGPYPVPGPKKMSFAGSGEAP